MGEQGAPLREYCASDLSEDVAADVAARLRGVVLAGNPVQCVVEPGLSRTAVRAGRLRDARRRRHTTEGFSRAGTRLDAEGRMSLTPESLAMEMAQRAAGRSVVDATCGAGGNAIAFARAGCQVIAIDTDAQRLALARHNAGRYGVLDRIDFRRGDARALLPTLRPQLLMLDPPWGTEHNREGLGPAALPLVGELLASATSAQETWIKLPPAFRVADMPGWTPRAVFGDADGDRNRVKFLWLARGTGADARAPR